MKKTTLVIMSGVILALSSLSVSAAARGGGGHSGGHSGGRGGLSGGRYGGGGVRFYTPGYSYYTYRTYTYPAVPYYYPGFVVGGGVADRRRPSGPGADPRAAFERTSGFELGRPGYEVTPRSAGGRVRSGRLEWQPKAAVKGRGKWDE